MDKLNARFHAFLSAFLCGNVKKGFELCINVAYTTLFVQNKYKSECFKVSCELYEKKN